MVIIELDETICLKYTRQIADLYLRKGLLKRNRRVFFGFFDCFILNKIKYKNAPVVVFWNITDISA